ncbi:MAG: FAD-binding protein [Hylemonella sp.]|jgi:tricarballylate dehydrogenase
MKHKGLWVVGQGAAGLSAAISAKEAAQEMGQPLSVSLLDGQSEPHSGGNTRWSPSNIRLQPDFQVEPGFVASMLAQSGGRADAAYFEQLAAHAPDTASWLQGLGVTFQSPPYYLAKGPARIQPVGGGAALLQVLRQRARQLGIDFVQHFRLTGLLTDQGRVSGVEGVSTQMVQGQGQTSSLRADAVVLACGGFQGNAHMLAQYLGQAAAGFRLISPGTGHNDGAGIRAALAAGALPSGDWQGAHAEPVDARSQQSAPVVLVYPFGLVLNTLGQRFFDEGAALMHETWEALSHELQTRCPQGRAYAIADAALLDIPDYQRAIRSEVPPIQADSLTELAEAIGVPTPALLATVQGFNAACSGDVQRFDASRTDGLACQPVGQPPKSNWARPLVRAPFLAWPLQGALVYTFGGLQTDVQARVLGPQGPIAGLYAAGEITGHFYGVAPNSVAMLRALVFGRIAGRTAFEDGVSG